MLPKALRWIIFALAVSISANAHACIMPGLKAPNNSAQIEAFKRDKAYYDALVMNYCSLKVRDDIYPERQAKIDRQIIDLLIEKWADPTPADGQSIKP